MTLEETAERVFKAQLPSSSSPSAPPHSFPFASGDTFRAAADVVFEKRFDAGSGGGLILIIFIREMASIIQIQNSGLLARRPRERWTVRAAEGSRRLGKGAIFFVRNGQAELFAKEVLPKLRRPFVLITHNGDDGMPSGIE